MGYNVDFALYWVDLCRRYHEKMNERERLHAQGGGVVAWDTLQGGYVFVEKPPAGFEVGDLMPEEWGIAPEVSADVDGHSR